MDCFSRKYHLITDCQHGFRKNHSTESALLVQKETILNNIEEKMMTLGIYLDFSKAFDRVNHTILLLKLEKYGFRGNILDLIRSYLASRTQFIEINECRSNIRPITSGVPQGSILGPILFLYYVNDIVNIHTKCKFVIYADDCTVFVHGKHLTDITEQAGRLCYELKNWSEMNSLSLNESKTKCVLYRPRNTPITVPSTIVLGPYTVNLERSVKTLGVVFTEHMSWNEHVDLICSKARKTVGIISKHRYFLPFKIKYVLYNSLFHSQLNYCTMIWGNTTANNLNKLTVLQKKAVRAIENLPYNAHTEELFKKNRIVRAFQIYNHKLTRSYKKAVEGKQAAFLELATLQQKFSPYTHRCQIPWHVPFSRTEYGRQRLCHTLPNALNELDKQHIDPLFLSKKCISELFL